jgi:hypothetical protein
MVERQQTWGHDCLDHVLETKSISHVLVGEDLIFRLSAQLEST